MEMGKVKRCPLDFDTLKRGMWIEAEELEEAIGCGLNHPNVNLRILALCSASNWKRASYAVKRKCGCA